MLDQIQAFVHENFIRPMIDSSVPGYNTVNTIVYGVILLVLAFYVIYPFLSKRKYVFDWNFMKVLLPYILFGTSLRVLEDQQIITRSVNPLDLGFYVFTPGIWILTFALVCIGLWLGKKIGKENHHKSQNITFMFGLAFALPLFVLNLLNAKEIIGGLTIIVIVSLISAVVFFLAHKMKWSFLQSKLAKVAFIGQALDTSATFVALEFFGCGEQHVLPRLLFGSFGNLSFFFVKIPIVLAVLYWLHKEYAQGKDADANLYGFILVFIAILGLATGTRDLITVLVGTCSP